MFTLNYAGVFMYDILSSLFLDPTQKATFSKLRVYRKVFGLKRRNQCQRNVRVELNF